MNPIEDLAIQANGYQQMYNDGQISAEEYKELINDMNIVGRINANAEQLEEDDEHHAMLMAALDLAEALA